MDFRKTLTFLSAVIILFTAGCAVNEKHPQYKVGQIYKTTKDSFVVFEYAAFIWQNRRDYQKIGYLYPFKSYPVAQEYQKQIKEQKTLEFEGFGNIRGGWAVYVPIGSQFKISKIYSYIPEMDKTIIVEIAFFNERLKDKKIILSSIFEDSNDAKLIE